MIAIVDYDAGNLRSVQRACHAVGVEAVITPDPDAIAAAERVIFPGVGTAASAMRTLRERALDEALRATQKKGTPILGICLGTQVILEHSEEGDTPCLGLVKGRAKRFQVQDKALKIPHMGWNAIHVVHPHPILEGIPDGAEFYFVHSYHPAELETGAVVCETEYEQVFPSALTVENLFATQFHPEKSGRFGLRMLENFTKWTP